MRPNSIVKFEQFYLGAMVIGLVNGALNWSNSAALLEADPSLAGWGSGFLVVSMVIGIGIALLLWYFAARKASNVAKWIITVFFGFSLISLPFSFGTLPMLNLVVTLVTYVLQAYAVYLLFQPDARQWFSTKGETPDLEKTFE